ncbi:hypothetical protein TMatcc_009709 [Talaromyces marneffei ATCC 18224]
MSDHPKSDSEIAGSPSSVKAPSSQEKVEPILILLYNISKLSWLAFGTWRVSVCAFAYHQRLRQRPYFNRYRANDVA